MKLRFLIVLLFPLYTFSQVGESYKDYLHSEFSDFFHTSEIKRVPYKAGEQREIKTGGFQDFITIYIYTDTVAVTIHEAILEIDREWMSEDASAELARDLVKSFLLDFIAKADQPKAMPAGEFLFARKATQDRFALDLNEVFTNKKDSLSQAFSKSTVTASNFAKEGRNYFRMTIAELGK